MVSRRAFKHNDTEEDFSDANEWSKTDEYGIKKGIVFSNARETKNKGKILYLPIYYVMFIEHNVNTFKEML